jgi:chorismate mutase
VAAQLISRAAVLAIAMWISALALGMAQSSQADGYGPLFALVDAASQRLQTADPVAAAKFKTGDPVDDPQREQQVIDNVTSAADAKHIDTEYVKGIFRDQMDATSAIERARLAGWKLNPGLVPAAVPDLTLLRATIDGLNRIMVDEIAAQWDSLNSANCATSLDDARRGVLAARQLDDLYRQALTSATRSYCR